MDFQKMWKIFCVCHVILVKSGPFPDYQIYLKATRFPNQVVQPTTRNLELFLPLYPGEDLTVVLCHHVRMCSIHTNPALHVTTIICLWPLQRAFCAFCSDRIWGLGRQGYKCINCKLLVHKRCHRLIKLTCGAAVVSVLTLPVSSPPPPPLHPIPPFSMTISVTAKL